MMYGKKHPNIVIILQLKSIIFFNSHNILQIIPCCHKWQDFLGFMAE